MRDPAQEGACDVEHVVMHGEKRENCGDACRDGNDEVVCSEPA